MKLDELRALAEAAMPANEYADPPMAAHMALVVALSPAVVLAMIDVIEAAKRVRSNTRIPGDTVTECKVPDCLCHSGADFDAALARLEQEQGR